ncbi:MAG: membrane integrity-associated transporter subunit PqiC [Planctomycetes bacterium]|nr:membrane integrity-associated transporter subunit PqiC [Planctomycetota bacterium]
MKNHKRNHLIQFIGITLLVSVICSGCAGMQGMNLEKQRYLLDVNRPGGQSETTGDLVVKVRRFHISSRFSGKSLTYRTGEVSYETDFYNEFLTTPASNITEEATKWIGQSGVFANVASTTSAVESDLLLEGSISSLYGDYRVKGKPRAVMGVWFVLLGNDGDIEFRKSYEATVKLGSNKPDELIKGLSGCLEEILTDLENDLRESY